MEIIVKDISNIAPSFYLPKVGTGGLSVGYQSADISIAQKYLYRKDISQYLLGQKIGDYKNVILIWRAKSESIEDFLIKKINKYIKKVKRKIKHIPLEYYDKMVLIILVPSPIYKSKQFNFIISSMLNNIRIRSKLTFFIVSRVWTIKNRYTYFGTLLCGSKDEFLESINNLEIILDVLGCWK